MDKGSRWLRRRFSCREVQGGEAHLLIRVSEIGGKKYLKGVQCDNPAHYDLAGGDCSWTCWEEISRSLGVLHGNK
jgi:hypothetical protein